jgi:hypothetical protein
MVGIVKQFAPTLGDLLKYEFQHYTYTREAVTFAMGTTYPLGQIVAKVTVDPSAVTVTPGTNTGTGTFTADATTPVLPGAIPGDYTVVCNEVVANAGQFSVYDPTGKLLGEVSVGKTWASQIKFAIADGATDFAVGDSFKVTVAAGSEKYVRCKATQQADGSGTVAGVVVIGVDATSADKAGVILARGPALLADAALLYDASVTTDAQKAAQRAALAAMGIVVRTTA